MTNNEKMTELVQYRETSLEREEFLLLVRLRRQPGSVIRRDADADYIRKFARKSPQFARALAEIRRRHRQ